MAGIPSSSFKKDKIPKASKRKASKTAKKETSDSNHQENKSQKEGIVNQYLLTKYNDLVDQMQQVQKENERFKAAIKEIKSNNYDAQIKELKEAQKEFMQKSALDQMIDTLELIEKEYKNYLHSLYNLQPYTNPKGKTKYKIMYKEDLPSLLGSIGQNSAIINQFIKSLRMFIRQKNSPEGLPPEGQLQLRRNEKIKAKAEKNTKKKSTSTKKKK